MPDYRAILRDALSPRLERDLTLLPSVCLSDIPEEGPFGRVIREPSVAETRTLFDHGIRELCNGGYALLILSGGLATRLGAKLPKAALPISPVQGKTLIQLHLERVRRLEALMKPGTPNLPVFIMTSRFNHDAIASYLKSLNYCDLHEGQVVLFMQDTAPYLQFNGHDFFPTSLDGSTVAEAPKGNGDVFNALSRCSEFMDHLKCMRMLHVIAIDNALSRPLDPELLGLALRFPGIEVLNKCVVRRRGENVGVFCLGKVPCVVEYSELEKLPDASFLNGSSTVYGNMCDHLFSGEFLRRIIDERLFELLPYHAAKKALMSSNATGQPAESNGYSLELFIFDVFQFASRLLCVEVNRDMQFAPVKYRADCDMSNLLSVQHRMNNVARQWLESAGAILGDGFFEISPSVSYCGEGLERYSGMHLEGTLYIE
ncbi:UDP-N-acetylglucosamine pyrophosphorylase [Babesia sp. Xinjiang]|uniref:UDP-N-acetylglucosamine pyrophosphorylase n=1 Tax=Babesia sp. Xinjiang TaxID=462227 RepID=UPI000A253247|nr:UDP-N-acetylglucosamine pyrophosphorylase [Babesia sp. Xinjiang]ORM42274.1 UDP-N-acetylglucosamine pyrophosphorylase [Babesia sp. Xinjiang]